MRKALFTEHQIIAVLKSVEAGRTVKDVCREAGISEASYYNWKAKFGGMEASDIKKSSSSHFPATSFMIGSGTNIYHFRASGYHFQASPLI